MRLALALFLVFHGLVHVLFLGWSLRRFALRPGMTWPDDSWALSRLLSERTTRQFATVVMAFAMVAFVVAGIALLFDQAVWQAVLGIAVASSTGGFILFWNGKLEGLPNQGAFAVLINVALALLVLV